MRLSGEQTLAWGRRRQGLEWGKCPHPSSQYRALSGAQPLSAAGKHPEIADGGREREREEGREGGREGRAELISFLCFVYLHVCVFWSWLNLYHLWCFCCLKTVIADNVLLCRSADRRDPVHLCFGEQKSSLHSTNRSFLKRQSECIFIFILMCHKVSTQIWPFPKLFSCCS